MPPDKVLVIPATFVVGESFPANLPLADGSVKPIAECSESEVRQAVEEVKILAEASRTRLSKAYEEHVEDLEMFAQLSAYLDRFEEWRGMRRGESVGEVIWSVDQRRNE